jgi:hypothetical protein
MIRRPCEDFRPYFLTTGKRLDFCLVNFQGVGVKVNRVAIGEKWRREKSRRRFFR